MSIRTLQGKDAGQSNDLLLTAEGDPAQFLVGTSSYTGTEMLLKRMLTTGQFKQFQTDDGPFKTQKTVQL